MPDHMPPFTTEDEALDMLVEIAARIAEEREHQPAPAEDPEPEGIPDDYIDQCLESNERGDGALYREVNRDRFLFVKHKSWNLWLKWQGHHWDVDHMEEHMTAVEDVALLYLRRAESYNLPLKRKREALRELNKSIADLNKRAKELARAGNDDALQLNHQQGREADNQAAQLAADIDTLKRRQKNFAARVDRLRTLAGIEKCARLSTCVESPLAIYGREIDQQPWLLACANGVVDLRTGELSPGRPDDYLVKSIPIAWPVDYPRLDHYLDTGENSPCPIWEKFITEIRPEDDQRSYLHRLFGYGITGHSTEHYIACFVGEGRNGKGTMFETIQEIMGDLAWRLQSEFILEQKTARNSSAASPDILSLMGRRIVIASETAENRHICAERVKEITGGDTLNCRGLFAKEEVNIKPTHTLFLQTNHIPKGLAKDFALRERLLLFNFPYRYVDDPEARKIKDPANAEYYRQKDSGLKTRLRQELPGILAWLVRGAILWQREGLQPPDSIKAHVEKLRLDEDHLEQFLMSGCIRPWDPGRAYQIESLADHDGARWESLKDDNQGNPPGSESTHWRWAGAAPDYSDILFKKFFEKFEAWYKDTVTDSDRYKPSKKAITKQMRDKGFTVKERGGHIKIFGGLELLA